MERIEPVNPARKVNLLLKIWLYPNVSAFKIAKMIPSLSDYRQNYHAMRLVFFMIVGSEMFILSRIPNYLNDQSYLRLFVLLSLIHGVPEIVLRKRIVEMEADYYAHYNKLLLYVFGVFLFVGLAAVLLYLNDQIGHVPSPK